MAFRWKPVRHRLHNARRAARTFLTAGGVSLHFEGRVDDGTMTAELRLPNQAAADRFVIVMRPFLDDSSECAYRRIWRHVLDSQEVPADERAAIDGRIEAAERGSFPFSIDGRLLTAKALHDLMAEAEFFGRNAEAQAELRGLCTTPLVRPLASFQFYSFPIDVLGVVQRLYRLRRAARPPHPPLAARCIFCLRDDGGFTSEEHIVPEALGNDEFILPPGIVCDRCNNGILSTLDHALMDFAPIAALRTYYLPYTQDGRLPRADFADSSWRKTRPNDIEFRTKHEPEVHRLPDGTTKIILHGRDRQPFRPHMLARAIHKIALETVALDCGVAQALNSRYDDARRFVLGDTPTFPNTLVLMTQSNPRAAVEFELSLKYGGTTLGLDIFGFKAVVNIEAHPRITDKQLPHGMPLQLFPLDVPPVTRS